MDLVSKLSMLSNSTQSDEDLAGICPPKNTPKISSDYDYDIDDSSIELSSISIDSYLFESGYKNSKKDKKKKKEKTIFDDIDINGEKKSRLEDIRRRTQKLAEMADLATADEFDSFMSNESLFEAEEDTELKNSLLSLGRKYARDSSLSKESSEIVKTFADSEKRLKALYEELDRDKNGVQKDIERMRLPRSGSIKSLSDMISVKNSMQSTQLQIVKEVNALRKNIYELRAKESARKNAEASGSADINTNMLQSLFSSSRGGMMEALGGYSGVSGANNKPIDSNLIVSDPDDLSDEEIQQKYFNDQSDSDGDKFLEYEDRAVEYVLIIDEDDKPQEILAEDKDGILIPDYPLPTDMSELSFTIDHTANTATDNMHRNYKVRKE